MSVALIILVQIMLVAVSGGIVEYRKITVENVANQGTVFHSNSITIDSDGAQVKGYVMK